MGKLVPALLLVFCLTVPVRAAAPEPIRVAFLDTGISTKHIAEAQIAPGKNYVFPENDTQDRLGHGTATAGMMLGAPSLGIAGSCPSAVAVPLVCYDLYPSGVPKNGGVEVLCTAIYDAVDLYHCRVINMSLGVAMQSDALLEAITYAEEQGAIVVSAVGNDALAVPERCYYPACYPTAIGVGAGDGASAADFSQRNGVSVLAPGTDLLSVTNRNAAEPAIVSGSSYACATVSGLCAAILTARPELTPAQVRSVLFASAADLGAIGFDGDSGWGLVGQCATESVTRGTVLSSLYQYDCYTRSTVPAHGPAPLDWATAAQISDGSNLAAPITRQEFATILYRYSGEPAVAADMSPFADSGEVSDFAWDGMNWAVANRVLAAPANLLSPRATVTRAEVAAAIAQYLPLS
ncbi:MAG: S8 family serine peptidase [Oscillospiraceae bacterium]